MVTTVIQPIAGVIAGEGSLQERRPGRIDQESEKSTEGWLDQVTEQKGNQRTEAGRVRRDQENQLEHLEVHGSCIAEAWVAEF